MNKSEEQAKVEVLQKYSALCSTHTCIDCPIGIRLGGGEFTCQELLEKFPQKAVAIIEEVDAEPNTYLKEFRRRFSYNKVASKELCTKLCRKGVFEGIFLTADVCKSDCTTCWNAEYVADVEDDELYEQAMNIEGITDDTQGKFEEFDGSLIGDEHNEPN